MRHRVRCTARWRWSLGNSPRPKCNRNEQQHKCSYCSHALILCEAYRTKDGQRIILTTTQQTDRLARAFRLRAHRRSRTMTTRFSEPSNVSGSAKIYTFPPRGRFALRIQDDESDAAASIQLPRGVRLVSGSGWYHDEAIQRIDRRRERSRAGAEEIVRAVFLPADAGEATITARPDSARWRRVRCRSALS